MFFWEFSEAFRTALLPVSPENCSNRLLRRMYILNSILLLNLANFQIF